MDSMKRFSSYQTGVFAFVGAVILLTLLAASPGLGTTDRYLPHGVCYAWQPGLVRLHLVADVLIGLAYFAIPIALVHFIRKRTDLPFNWMFLLFGLFIVACGATHWMEVWTLWNPSYWLAGGVKIVTAAASVPTAILLFMLIPRALALPSIAQVEAANSALEREVDQRRHAEAALEESRHELEVRVEQRTAELRTANALLERQRADLAHADRAKNNFLAILSHELRNPVHAIRTNAWVIRALTRDEPKLQAASAIERQVAKLSVLLEDLLDVVSVSRNTKLKLAPADLHAIVDAAVETTRTDFLAKRQKLDISGAPESLPISADASRLEQAVANVLNNASKYTPEQGEVSVRLGREDDDVTVSIRDNGVGIASEEIAHVFQLFSRGSAASMIQSEGLGVGLYIAHELVAGHGGSISVKSEGPGKGSEFVIRVPRAEMAVKAPAAAAEPIPVTGGRAGATMRILVVDDNKDAADSLAQVLRMTGHDVIVTYEGEAAIAIAREHDLDVALIDIGLPTVNGYDIARTLSGARGAPVMIAVTGWGADDDKAKAFAAGFARHLTKPVDLAALTALLDEIAALRPAAG
jgi:signal transduction histidine kinase/CheY-like chemotaxis protein